ncbi:LysM peptidoglycan-binding and 3D domain-containing protein [Oceanobacillus chungangensis]|uniref:Cell wall-binding protein n=1 Tax=Oceanobacillus chungangensis TaxID=1229152 RepID=A0A3D8Q0G7_9BACI|nr:3D domain-containing protein [Oceanobacillus chungangensis]RDW20465.1 cell wall-binding protein [Oceanobacillus chungangensis]
MKKFVAAIATGIIIAGAAVTNVSAEEYEVQKGDSLWDIANETNTTVDELIDINELKDSVIHPKQLIIIKDKYSVRPGDTLSSIANEQNVTLKDLREWNDLRTDLIVIGQELSIKNGNVKQDDIAVTKESSKPATTDATSSEKNTQNTASAQTEAPKSETQEKQAPQGKTISVKATAYTAKCEGCSGLTYTGVDLNANPNAKVIAVDPNVIPLGSEVYVEGYGYATAADIGGAIKGNKIDIHVPTTNEAMNWGVRTVDVTIVK